MDVEKFKVVQVGNVAFYAKHQILKDICLMIASHNELNFNENINVFIGVHEWVYDEIPVGAISVGVQTEQYRDESSKKLWASKRSKYNFVFLSKFDCFLDLSET